MFDLESNELAVDTELSDAFVPFFDLSSLSAFESISIGSSFSSFPLDPFVASVLSLVFFVAVSVNAFSTAPFVLELTSLEVAKS